MGSRVWAVALLAACLWVAVSAPAAAQHDHAGGHDRTGTSLFAGREVSGTAWQPEATPMHGVHAGWRGWELMLHGNVFVQWLYEPAERHRSGGMAEQQVSSMNWGMAMARRPLAGGRFGLRGMASVEPWTVSDCGFLNFLATGETCEGDTIHDRQHPHDLLMEVAADYDRSLRGTLRWHVYGGLAGEPALGPAGFPHRLSAIANPMAPITHHWLDATHISFGVVTAGVSDRRWRAEVSAFNGREPDEQRAGVDWGALDSIAARLSWLPTDRLAIQVSGGRLREAEFEFAPLPRTDVDKITASAVWHRPAGRAVWATTLAYGMNRGTEALPEGIARLTTHAGLLETSVQTGGHTWFGRAELAGKPAHDLHAHEFGAAVFTFAKLQAGYLRSVSGRGVTAGLGATVFASLVPEAFRPHYAGRVAPGVGVFVNLRPGR
jgi:hypothetical protein